MKRSIKHLPKRTQEELNYLLDAIQRKVKDCEMIILYGSYARGGYVLWDEQIENGVRTSYQSDLDILVVVSNGNVRLKEQSIRSKVVEKYHEKFAYRRHAFPQIIVEYSSALNEALEKSQYFFTDIIKEGIKMYDTGAFTLAKPRKLSFKEIKEMAEDEYSRYFPDGEGFLEIGNLWLEKEKYRLGSFQLHQSCERFYNAASLVCVNYRPKSHKLVELAAHAKIFTRAFTTVFPIDTEFGKHCYDLLCRAYIEARYNKYFDVTREEYEYMLEKVSLLREVTLRVCQERFAYYDQMIAEEEQQTGERDS